METRAYTTIEYTTIDREGLGWPSGEWDGEPDKLQWTDEATGLPCLAVRHPRLGNWCGYVGVPPEHPLHGRGYEDLDLEVHGGLSFAHACQPHESEADGICHVPGPGEPEHVWWLGFDCAHGGDLSPGLLRKDLDWLDSLKVLAEHEIYRPLAYVKGECARLAAQLLAAGHRQVT
jgi:hypothetical protein